MPAANAVSESVAAGGTLEQDVNVAAEDFLTVIGDVGPGASAAGDVSVVAIPYLSDSDSDFGGGPTLADSSMALVQDTEVPGVAAALANGHARVMVRLRVMGFEKVRLVLTNHHASALPARLDFYVD